MMHTLEKPRMWLEIESKYLHLVNYESAMPVPWDEKRPDLHFVVVLADRIGDAFNSIYFLSNLRRLYPQARVTYVGSTLDDPAFMKHIIGQYVDRVCFKELLGREGARDLKPDVVFDLNPLESLFPYHSSGRTLRIGHPIESNIVVPQLPYNMKANDHLNLFRIFGKSVEFRYKPIILPPRQDDRVLMARPPAPYVALCLEATAKSWMMSEETISSLIDSLLSLGTWDILILGCNINENGYPYRGRSPRVHQCTGAFSLFQSICLLEGAECVISVDTGLMHAASYLGKPLLAVFTCGEPRKNGPQGQYGTTVLVNVHSEAPKVVEKRDRLQSFMQHDFLRPDHVLEGLNALRKAEPCRVEERVSMESVVCCRDTRGSDATAA